jgi:hypothetical protein
MRQPLSGNFLEKDSRLRNQNQTVVRQIEDHLEVREEAGAGIPAVDACFAERDVGEP